MVGQWDGCNLWLQWTAAPPPAMPAVNAPAGQAPPVQPVMLYRVRIRLRATGTEWKPWVELGTPLAKAWRVVSTMREGWEIQAQIAAVVQGSPQQKIAATDASLQWENATEAAFARSTCVFSFLWSGPGQPPAMPKGTVISDDVEGAGCSYRTAGEVILVPGQAVQAPVEALHLSGYCQIDNPGDFVARPVRGLLVTNVAPSQNDLAPTANPAPAFTKLARLPHPGGPGVLVKTGAQVALPLGSGS